MAHFVGAIAKHHHPVQVVHIDCRGKLIAHQRGEYPGLVVRFGGGELALPHWPQHFVAVQRELAALSGEGVNFIGANGVALLNLGVHLAADGVLGGERIALTQHRRQPHRFAVIGD